MGPRTVVTLAVGGGFSQGQARLLARLAVTDPGLAVAAVRGRWPEGCPSHDDLPYAFKIWMMRRAFDAGAGTVLWMDSSAVPRRSVAPLFEIAEREGAFVSDNYGWKNGQWATDAFLSVMGTTRDEQMAVPHCSALVFGVCVGHPKGAALFAEMERLARVPEVMAGARENGGRSCSADPRCLGHRHDQTLLSLLAHRMAVPLQPNELYVHYGRKGDSVIAALGNDQTW